MNRAEKPILSKPHAVCIPFPAQGHINPMLKLAKLLHIRGFHITFVNTEFNHRRLLKSRGPYSLNGLSSFRFQSIPDGLPPSNEDATQDVPSLCEACKTVCLAPFRDLVTRLNDNSSFPPISCIISDAAMSFTLQVSEELGIPYLGFWTGSGCSLWALIQYPKLVEGGYFPLKDESYLINGHLDTIIDWIPGMEGIRLKNLPSFIRSRVDEPSYIVMKYIVEEIVDKIPKFSALIFNTIDTLESNVLQQISTKFPAVYTIGPLHLPLLNNLTQDDDLNSIGSNLWKEDTDCLEWLDTKKPNSVVYVNFGSVTVMSNEQLIEFAWGLANIKMNFLWITRSDLVMGDSAILPHEFLAETKERGLLGGWCPQEQVLSHPSIGGFITHCGWNSTLESISFGVPMLCWPFFADQQTNCWFICNRWGVGMEIDSNVKREVIEKLVRELMIGEKGKEMKENALKWKKLAEETITSSNGSSYMNFEKLVSHVLLRNGPS
ncbi:7-deoxyloganetin glucosyltransferase-like [Lycium barbarum]|uniref:Glycosyltransferase n=1 Tax=Lycium barbarum TaxID=112863 RepID=B6EWY9_LYCBA|nr:7-deoxyloganetin glucosyltransferase-like [Lycium barbarum]BAG80552.1 UDP-glucose:glucosyltransferase [Lycium barbarum]